MNRLELNLEISWNQVFWWESQILWMVLYYLHIWKYLFLDENLHIWSSYYKLLQRLLCWEISKKKLHSKSGIYDRRTFFNVLPYMEVSMYKLGSNGNRLESKWLYEMAQMFTGGELLNNWNFLVSYWTKITNSPVIGRHKFKSFPVILLVTKILQNVYCMEKNLYEYYGCVYLFFVYIWLSHMKMDYYFE